MLLESTVPDAPAAAEPRQPLGEAEFNRLYQGCSDSLWRYIARLTGDSVLADDIFQKTFFRFLRSGPAAGDEVRLRALLFRIATNLVIDHWRQQKHERQWQGNRPPDLPAAPQREFSRDVRNLLRRIKPRERALLWMAHAEEMSHREIAEALGLAEKSVRVLLFRARKRFAELLRNHGISAEVLQ
jgi:RNA polymerase sigma-70 factor (ECF subfamily)